MKEEKLKIKSVKFTDLLMKYIASEMKKNNLSFSQFIRLCVAERAITAFPGSKYDFIKALNVGKN